SDLEQIGMAGSLTDTVRRLSALAVGAGACGLVCSPREVAAVRGEVGPGITLIPPRARPAGPARPPQPPDRTADVARPPGAETRPRGEAVPVLGPPITGAPAPGTAAAAIAAPLRRLAPASG